jgi:hypothetical protein
MTVQDLLNQADLLSLADQVALAKIEFSDLQ